MTKRAIFSYANFQIDNQVKMYQSKVIEKFNMTATYEYLEYNASDGKIIPHQVIDYALPYLFFKKYYQTVLILDIDCVPMSTEALEYTFEQAEKDILIGNAQRSNHLDNGQHVYVAPSAMCITKSMFIDLNFPSFFPDHIRSDVGEDLTYLARDKNLPIEIFGPKSYEESPNGAEYWPLNDNYKNYGIGTIFENKDGMEMFYHLFESRLTKFNHLFYKKCEDLLNV